MRRKIQRVAALALTAALAFGSVAASAAVVPKEPGDPTASLTPNGGVHVSLP